MRPWGPLQWLSPKLPRESLPVVFLCCVGSEERCVASPRLRRETGPATDFMLFTVQDPPSRYSARIGEKTAENLEKLGEAGINIAERKSLRLLDSGQATEDLLAETLSRHGDSPIELWIDISTVPKRIFFLLIKLALEEMKVRTLIITYTQAGPGLYTEEHLAENPDEVSPLPGFGPIEAQSEPDMLCVSVGFEALGLRQFLDEYRDKRRRIVLLMPFPPGQPYSRRTWSSVMEIGESGSGANVRRLHAVDAFGAYEELCAARSVDDARVTPVALAPYGPKPMSLGMCLYAVAARSPVFYTQPRVYHPDYSRGIGQTWAYCLRLNGRDMVRLA
jgi:hypothetical protein